MTKTKWTMIVLALVAVVIFAQDSFAASEQAEDKVIGIIDRILDMIAEFLDKVFQSMADAVRSVWSPEDKK